MACLVLMLGTSQTPRLAAEPALDAPALKAELDALLRTHPTQKRTTVALKVVDVQTGEVLYDRLSDRLMTPASNLKIYTSAAALALLGPDARWDTQWRSDTKPVRGNLRGDLVLVGFGDPMFSAKQLRASLTKLVETQKLRSIAGKVRVIRPEGWSSLPDKGPGWMWDDEPDYYNMTITPAMMDFNVLSVRVEPSPKPGDPMNVFVTPPTRYPIVKHADPSPAGTNPAWRVGFTASEPREGEPTPRVRIDRTPFQDDIEVQGSLRAGAKPAESRITMHDPERWIASVATVMLDELGVKVLDRQLPRTTAPDRLPPILLDTSRGKSLAEASKHFLKVSENAVGELFLLTLAKTHGDHDRFGPEVSWPKGAAAISNWLVQQAGLDEGSFRLVDGSGLSRYNLISADSSIRLLRHMASHEHFEPFFDGMPIYKVALPLANAQGQAHWNGTPLAEFSPERVFAKPGGMSGVNTISGYLDTLDGRRLAFSLLANGYIGSSAPVRDLRGKVWATLIRYQAEPVPAPAPAQN